MVYKIRSVLVSFRCRGQEEDSDKTIVGQRSTDSKPDQPQSEGREDEVMSESPEHSRGEMLDENMDHDSDHEHHDTDGNVCCSIPPNNNGPIFWYM